MTVNVTFHADLSDAHPGEDHWLSAQGERFELTPHTDATRAAARVADPSLANVSDASLTHFSSPVPMPDAQVVRVHLRHTLTTFQAPAGTWAASHAAIHIPPPLPASAAPMQAEFAAAPPAFHPPPPQPMIDYLSTAQALLFHHADLLNGDPATTSTIYAHMNTPTIGALINNLAQTMRDAGPPSLTGGWALQVPITPDADPDAGIDGTTTYYQTDPTDATRAAAGAAMTALMVATKNDMSLQGMKWQQQTGTSVQMAAATPMQSMSMAQSQSTILTSAAGNATWSASLANTSRVDGLQVSISVDDPVKRSATLTLNNTYIRYLGAYIRFYDVNGAPVIDSSWTPNDNGFAAFMNVAFGYDNSEIHFLGVVDPVDNILAIPIESAPGSLSIGITFPPTAVSASVYGSGIGTGSNPWPNTPVIGGVLTGVFNLGVPAFMLGFQVAAQSNKPLYAIVKTLTSNKVFVATVIGGAAGYFAADSAVEQKVSWKALQPLGTMLLKAACKEALLWVESTVATQKIVGEIPFAGWILVALDIAVGVAQIAETIVDVASSSWNIENTIATAITTTATVYPDPRQGAFPAGNDASYVVRMIYKDEIRPSVVLPEVPVTAGSTGATLVAAFPNNTLGGMIKIEADYFVGQWLAARATTGWIANDEVQSNVTLYLVENPVPLNAQSIYAHASLLTYQNSAYVWQPTAVGPTATLTNNNNNSVNAVNIWSGLALSQRHAMIGFAWQAVGTGLSSCSSLQPGGDVYAMQSVQIPGVAQNTVKFQSCAFDAQMQIVYDSFPPKFQMAPNGSWLLGPDNKPVADPSDVQVGSYYVDPRMANISAEAGGGYHLRRITLDATTPFPVDQDLPSYGRFPYYPDAIALHPSGHVIGVNQMFARIQVTALQADPGVPDAAAPLARTYSGTAYNPQRPGLLFTPMAVSCSYDGTIFILENLRQSTGSTAQIVARIQAFDLSGNPVNRFFDASGAPSPFLQLPPSAGVTYLDLVVIGTNTMTYFYVLSYTGDGSAPADYQVAIYQYGNSAPAQNPLVTTGTVPAARLAVDMWHTLYTLNYDMVTDGHGNYAGPTNSTTGANGRTVPSVSQWLPPVPA